MYLIREIQHLLTRKDLIRYLLKSSLKMRYKNAVLGFFWAVLEPLLMMFIYILLVRVIFQKGTEQFPILLFSTLLPWRWFVFSVVGNTKLLIANAKIITTVKFPFSILALNEVNVGLFNFLFGIIVLIPMLFIFDATFSIHMLWVIPIIAVQYVFIFGLGLIFATMGLYFRDLQFIVQFLIRIGFYLSPALYELSFVPQKFQLIYLSCNPFASLFDAYKNVLVKGLPPSWHFLIFVGYALILLFIGVRVFSQREYRFAKDI